MKKAILILTAVTMSAGFLTSCKKEYTCVCTVNNIEVIRQRLAKQKKKDAQAECEKTYNIPGVPAKCSLD